MSNTRFSPAGAPTPPQEDQPTGAYASYVPHDLKYSREFEDAVMRVVNRPPKQNEGIRIIPEDSSEIPVDGISVKADAISLQSLQSIAEHELPLPLNDPRRIFASSIPGIKLTHPGGYLEGGPGLDPEMDTFAEDFVSRHPHAISSSTLQSAQAKEIESHIEELRQRMRNRQRAITHNEGIERELQTMREQHALERKMQREMADKRRAKKEAKEKEGG